MANKILVFGLDGKFKKSGKKIESAGLKILKILNKDGLAAEIYLINSRQMRLLNKKFRGKNKTTTILSFVEPRNFILPASKFRKIGEIYLNLDKTTDYRPRATANHKKAVVSSPWTVDRLLIHGLLHLVGYNHQRKSDRIKMERKEKLICTLLL